MTDAAPMPPAIEQLLGARPQTEAARALRTLSALILGAEPIARSRRSPPRAR